MLYTYEITDRQLCWPEQLGISRSDFAASKHQDVVFLQVYMLIELYMEKNPT